MQTSYKEKILKDLDKIPADKLPNLYRIIHLLTDEIKAGVNKTGKRVSLRGIWKGSQIDDSLFIEARKSLYNLGTKSSVTFLHIPPKPHYKK